MHDVVAFERRRERPIGERFQFRFDRDMRAFEVTMFDNQGGVHIVVCPAEDGTPDWVWDMIEEAYYRLLVSPAAAS
jgi:hypothetical protein